MTKRSDLTIKQLILLQSIGETHGGMDPTTTVRLLHGHSMRTIRSLERRGLIRLIDSLDQAEQEWAQTPSGDWIDGEERERQDKEEI